MLFQGIYSVAVAVLLSSKHSNNQKEKRFLNFERGEDILQDYSLFGSFFNNCIPVFVLLPDLSAYQMYSHKNNILQLTNHVFWRLREALRR